MEEVRGAVVRVAATVVEATVVEARVGGKVRGLGLPAGA